MEIGALASTALYQMNQSSTSIGGFDTPSELSVAMLSKQLEVSQTSGEALVRAMELSINPGIGSNVDLYV